MLDQLRMRTIPLNIKADRRQVVRILFPQPYTTTTNSDSSDPVVLLSLENLLFLPFVALAEPCEVHYSVFEWLILYPSLTRSKRPLLLFSCRYKDVATSVRGRPRVVRKYMTD